ncbi:Alpha/Beta hydrolase protein [Chiua virens]|nr:Alpha/Beta hydrolase protein [Chiua virens]
MDGQPIHPEILPRLDPEYVEFHNKYIAHLPAPHTLPWDPSIRNRETVPGAADTLQVGSVKDYDLSKTKVRVFTPEGPAPEGGWPVYCWYHGGGWTLGSINAENAFCSRVCKGNYYACLAVRGSKAVFEQGPNVWSPPVDYRLAPEHPYPAAVEDSLETLQWVYEKGSYPPRNQPRSHCPRGLISVGKHLVHRVRSKRLHSGGNLSAIISMKAAQLSPPISILHVQMIVPVTDNTAQPTGDRYPVVEECANTVWLNTGRMIWFRDFYVPNVVDREKWDCSPIFAPDELLAKSPPTWVAVMELDILRDEGLAYADRLKKVGVSVTSKMYKGAPHQILAMDVSNRVLAVGRELVADTTRNLAEAFGTMV